MPTGPLKWNNKKDQACQAITLEHDWSLFAPLEAVTQIFHESLCERPKSPAFLFNC